MKTSFSYITGSAALLTAALVIGCGPSGPTPAPEAADIFDPTNGTAFQSELQAVVSLSGLSGAVCYTVDGSTPDYTAGSCSGGTTATVSGPINLACDTPNVSSPTPVLENHTINIVFEWNNGVDAPFEVSRTASYDIDCTAYALFVVGGGATISGPATGTAAYGGFARLNPLTGVLEFQIENTSNTTSALGAANILTVQEGAIVAADPGTGWDGTTITAPVGTSYAASCTNLGGDFNACLFVNTGIANAADMGITDATTTFDFTSGQQTTINAVFTQATGAVVTSAFVLTAL